MTTKLLCIAMIIGLALSPHIGLSQNGSIFGMVQDTNNYKPMAYSSVSLIKKDASLYRTQFVNTKNEFRFSQLPADTYRLLITRPSYADYEEDIVLGENETKNLGSISLKDVYLGPI